MFNGSDDPQTADKVPRAALTDLRAQDMEGWKASAAAALEKVRAKIAAAQSERSAGSGQTVLLAATKTVPAEVINHLADHCGLTLIGENRVQELLSKYDALHRSKLTIHFIGSLQKNKVKYIIDKVSLIHSVDSLGLAREIDEQAAKHGLVMDVLAEINIGREPNKGGVMPEDASDFVGALTGFGHIRPVGVMTMAPVCASEDEYRRYFLKTYEIYIDISQNKLHNIDNTILSMGMSDSYECAVTCGSNLVRVGSAIFGKRAVSPENNK